MTEFNQFDIGNRIEPVLLWDINRDDNSHIYKVKYVVDLLFWHEFDWHCPICHKMAISSHRYFRYDSVIELDVFYNCPCWFWIKKYDAYKNMNYQALVLVR